MPIIFQLTQSLARHYEFECRDPPNIRAGLSEQPSRRRYCTGSGKEKDCFSLSVPRRGSQTRKHPIVGIIPNLEKR